MNERDFDPLMPRGDFPAEFNARSSSSDDENRFGGGDLSLECLEDGVYLCDGRGVGGWTGGEGVGRSGGDDAVREGDDFVGTVFGDGYGMRVEGNDGRRGVYDVTRSSGEESSDGSGNRVFPLLDLNNAFLSIPSYGLEYRERCSGRGESRLQRQLEATQRDNNRNPVR